MTIHELETPALLIDLDIMERNLLRVAEYAKSHGLGLRPHIKTHKIPELARQQIALGALGITCAKVGEAEVMLEAQPPEILLAYPVIGASKLARLMEVARRTRLLVALDDMEVARPLSAAAQAAGVEVGVLVEADVGLGRVGIPPAEVHTLAKEIGRLPNLRADGVTFYPGHVKALDSEALAELSRLNGVVHDMANGYRVVSGGSTPLLFESHRLKALTEIRPGTYIFNDRNTVVAGACTLADCAARILCTVVSTARPGHMILDGGSKTFSSDRLSTGSEVTFGEIDGAPGARFHKMNEEHGYVALREGERFRVGDRVKVLPNHVCVAVNLHERIYGVRGETVEETWAVKARGKLQ